VPQLTGNKWIGKFLDSILVKPWRKIIMPIFEVDVVKKINNLLIDAKTKEEAEAKAASACAHYDFSDPNAYECTAQPSDKNKSDYILGHDGWLIEKFMTISCIDLRKLGFFTKENINKYAKLRGNGNDRYEEYLKEQSIPNEKDKYTSCGPRTKHGPSERLTFNKQEAKDFNISWNEKYVDA
jgi:hypothetical protein